MTARLFQVAAQPDMLLALQRDHYYSRKFIDQCEELVSLNLGNSVFFFFFFLARS